MLKKLFEKKQYKEDHLFNTGQVVFFIKFFKKNNNHSLIFSPIVLPEKGNTNIMLQVKSVLNTEISYTERISYWTISRIITT